MDEAMKRLIDIAETLGRLEQKVDNTYVVQNEMKEDLDSIKTCYAEHSERITKAEEKIKELDKQKSGIVASIIGLATAIITGFISHMMGGK